MSRQPFFITTPIYYVNDRPHIGHAYTSVACDVLARFHRLDGREVRFLTGTDEHGQKVEKSARLAGVTPQALADANSEHFRALTTLMNIRHDDFIRTTESRHIAAAQALWARMQERGFITPGSYSGWYAVRDEAYYQESELVNGKAPTGADVEWVEEPSYFFRLSAFGDKLLEHYRANPGFIAPESRRNEVMRFVEGGLKDLSISRTTFSWGIPVPGDEKHVMYVWLDALANYLSALGYPDEQAPDFVKFWPADLHMVGKDILRFHTVYWPAFLMAADLPLPRRVFAHGWWTIEGEKMSKSLGNAVHPAELVERYGVDQTRWFLMREVPFGNDGNFSHEGLIARVNSELANNIGNLVQRTLSMVAKNCDGKVPNGTKAATGAEVAITGINFDKVRSFMNANSFDKYLQDVINWASEANAFIDKEAPWTLKKQGKLQEMHEVLYDVVESIRKIAICLLPFIPDSMNRVLDQLAISKDERMFEHLAREYALKPGTLLPPPQPVFPRLEPRAAQAS